MDLAPPLSVQPHRERLLMLDAMRGLASLCVAGFHLTAFQGSRTLLDRGYLSVDFFFIVSGLVLCPIFEKPHLSRQDAVSLTASRFLRFWPLMAFGTVLGLLHGIVFENILPSAGILVMALCFIPLVLGKNPQFPLNGPQWSLACELLFNALHIFVLRRISGMILAGIAASGWVILLTLSMSHGSMEFGHDGATFLGGMARIGFGYILGCILGRTQTSWRPIFAALPWWLAPTLFILILIFPVAFSLSAAISDPLSLPILALVTAMSCAAQFPERLRGVAHQLGAISFPLYAIHYPLLHVAHSLSDIAPSMLRMYCYPAAAIAGILIAFLLAQTWLTKGLSVSIFNIRTNAGNTSSTTPLADLKT